VHALADPQGNVVPGNAHVRFTEEEIAQMTARPVGRKQAHAFLSQWRSANTEGAVDLTDRLDIFNWAGYVANHRDRQVIFDGGRRRITKFSIQRIDVVMDTNTRDARVDFLITGDDGVVIRAHPSQNEEAKLVVVPSERVSPVKETVVHHVSPRLHHGQGGAPLPPRGHEQDFHYMGVSQADLMPTRRVQAWAERRLQRTIGAGQPYKLNVTMEAVDHDLVGVWFNGVE
jgi:hypothetical protein